MAALYNLTDASWTLIATRGNPSMRIRDVDRARVHIGSAAPALAATDYVTLDNGRVPVNFGALSGGRRMWARAENGRALLEVEDSGKGAENVARLPSAAASVNATLVKATPGRVFRVFGRNNAAAIRYLKIYDKASAAPTVGTDTPLLTIPLAPSSPFNEFFGEDGILFATGIGYALTTGVADNDAGALTAADVLGLHLLWA